MKIYLSGPMSGYPESNYPRFNEVARILRKHGHTVYNPAEFTGGGEHVGAAVFPLKEAFTAYSHFICNEATAIALLPGWWRSPGATAELALARCVKLEVYLYHSNLGLVEVE